MAVPVEVPKLGNTVEDCLVAKWRRRTGDRLSAGEVVAELETDKASFEIVSPVAGTLLATFFDEGALAPVFANLFVVGEPDEDPQVFRPAASVPDTPASGSPADERRSSPDVATAPPAEPASPGEPRAAAPFSPRARRFAAEHGFHPASVRGSGPGGRVVEDDLRTLYHTSPRSSGAARAASDGKASAVPGSGIGGMVLLADLGQAAAPTESRMSKLRETIARRMRESLATTAQYTLNTSADARGLLLLRARLKASNGTQHVTLGDLVAFCAVRALLEVPGLNAHFSDGKVEVFGEVHLGFACDTPRGLLVPVVRDAHTLGAAQLAARLKELAAQAVKGTIAVDDLRGGTFTMSNLGALGIESFTPLINPPQVAILGVNAIQLKAVRKEGRVELIDSIGLSLTLDHQVVDGAPGARFLGVLRDKIEHVERVCTM
jgi:pyruvate dehydrogenase E2 component (dihydrolipoamide acetyltransferase)